MGMSLQDDINGVNLVPELMQYFSGSELRCLLLGASAEQVEAAKTEAQ